MIDQIIVLVYLVITIFVGLYVGRNTKTLEDFAIGSRNFSTLVLVSTVFASVVDAGMTTGLASSTYSVGPIFLLSFIGIIFSNINVSYLIAPKMKPFLGLLSSGDIFEKLYRKRAKTLMGCSTIIESILTTAIQIFAITQIGSYFFNLHPLIASIIISMIIVLYTFRGGIKSVTATDVFQFGIMIIAIPMMCGFALVKIGGLNKISELLHKYSLFFPTEKKPEILQYIAVFISFSLPCLYPLCIQRMLMAKNSKQISATFLTNGLLSLPFYLAVGLIGIIAYIAIPGTDANVVFPTLVNEVLPTGARGLVLAGLIAIFMSTIDSILNIGSLAIIHDVLGSITKKELSPKLELRLLKIASFTIAISAVIICHFFTSVMDIVFLLMVIGNAIFFPGFFWGIMGFKASKIGFWIGVIGGILTVITCTIVFDLFPLYTMLLAIVINSTAILINYVLEHPRSRISIKSFWQNNNNQFINRIRRNAFFTDAIMSQEYCTVFFVCAIAVSIFPFFFPAIYGLDSFDGVILSLNAIVAVVSLCLLFRELWWDHVNKVFPFIWLLLLTLSLPTQSLFMTIKSNFSIIWFVDSIMVIPLLLLLTTTRAAFMVYIIGFIIAIFANFFGYQSITSEVASGFGYWALVIHITFTAICLALFRKSDKDTFYITSSTLAHEASRSFLAFENAACYLNTYLPKIINIYQSDKTNIKDISNNALKELLDLPNQLEQAAKRSRYIVKKLSFHSMAQNANFEEMSLIKCIQEAINDPAIKSKTAEIVSVETKHDLIIKGDIHQLTQVFINILENSIHAIKNKSKPLITIKIAYDYVIIRDNGEGIYKHDLVNIFDENFSTKSSKGYGLAFCKRVIKNHGGTISCSSISGEFTEFRLSFPIEKRVHHV